MPEHLLVQPDDSYAALTGGPGGWIRRVVDRMPGLGSADWTPRELRRSARFGPGIGQVVDAILDVGC